MQAQALDCVARAGGLEAANPAEELRQRELIDPNQKNQGLRDHRAQPVCECLGGLARPVLNSSGPKFLGSSGPKFLGVLLLLSKNKACVPMPIG